MSAPKRPDIVVICDPCGNRNKNETDAPVQKFKWRDGMWIPKDTSGEKWNANRNHCNTRCDYCGRGVKMNWDRAQLALTAMWVEAEATFAKLGMEQDAAQPLKFTLRKLQDAYDSVPASAVQALPGRHAEQ